MVIGVFILVIMSLLAATMLRVNQIESQAATHEFLAVKAFYAAESAAQWAMNELFLSLVTPVVNGECPDVEGSFPDGISGQWKDTDMQQCRLVEHVICRSRTLGLADAISSYHISATAECGSDSGDGDPYVARRTVTMEATRLVN